MYAVPWYNHFVLNFNWFVKTLINWIREFERWCGKYVYPSLFYNLLFNYCLFKGRKVITLMTRPLYYKTVHSIHLISLIYKHWFIFRSNHDRTFRCPSTVFDHLPTKRCFCSVSFDQWNWTSLYFVCDTYVICYFWPYKYRQ